MATATYTRRKAAGVCPACEAVPAAGHTYCDTCIAAMRWYNHPLTPEEQSAAANRDRLLPLLTTKLPEWTGHELGCLCGTFYPITQIPFVTPCCGFVLALHAEVTP